MVEQIIVGVIICIALFFSIRTIIRSLKKGKCTGCTHDCTTCRIPQDSSSDKNL